MKVLLYSGGMDSWLIEKLWNPDLTLYVSTGSRYMESEIKNLKRDVEVVDFINLHDYEREDAIIPYRNVYLCLAALNEVERRWPLENHNGNERTVEICLGATAGDRVLDKSPYFASKLGELLTYLSAAQHWTGGKSQSVKIAIPFKSCTKRDLLKMYVERGGKLKDAWSGSFSCYDPVEGRPCGKCKPCARKTVAFTLEGFRPEGQYIELAKEYFIESGIIKQIEDGTYGRAEEERDILEFMKC